MKYQDRICRQTAPDGKHKKWTGSFERASSTVSGDNGEYWSASKQLHNCRCHDSKHCDKGKMLKLCFSLPILICSDATVRSQ